MTRGPIRAPRGRDMSCHGWVQEAALRMLMNNLDPDVAERPEDLVVYGGIGKAARNWQAFDHIVASLRSLRDDETLLIQSGKPVGILPSHPDAPRVLLVNSMLVPAWANWEVFRELDKKGLIMFGQMTAGSWIYIGTQGILQGTHETFVEAGRQHFGGDLGGRIILTAGLGGMGGAQPLAATMAGAIIIAVEIDPHRIQRRLETGYCQKATSSLDEALSWAFDARTRKEALSIALEGNAAEIYPEFVRRGVVPDLVTDQTSAHDPLNGYVPLGLSLAEANSLRVQDPTAYIDRAMDSMAVHVRAMLDLKKMGAHVFDYGNNIRARAQERGVTDAFDFPGFVPAYIRPLFCRGSGPFRWVALSGDPADIYRTDQALRDLFPQKESLHNWLDKASKQVKFQGLPARICWLEYGERQAAGQLFNELVRKGEVSAPLVIGRDHLDTGSVASPNRETEAMKDGSDAIADWPILNALINSVNGASWVSVHHGGGVGMGYSIHSGMVIVADGTEAAARRLYRVLNSDPGMGILRHADAGYDIAQQVARDKGVKIPGLTT